MGKGTSALAWNAEARDAIRQSDVLRFLLDTAAGVPAVRRDSAGRPIGHHDEPDMATRVQVATTLLNRVLPTVSAQAVDVTSNGEGGQLVIQLGAGLPAPASVDDDPKDVTPETEAIEHKHAAEEMPIRTRRRKPA